MILDKYGISKDSSERHRLFHQVDFLFPEASLVIEIDSKYHKNKTSEDKARDEYLHVEYGLTIFRYYNFDFKNHIKEITNYLQIDFPCTPIEYKSKSDEYLEVHFYNELNYLSQLYQYSSKLFIQKYRGILLTRKDIQNLNWNDGIVSMMVIWIKEFWNKDIICTDSSILETGESLILKFQKGNIKKDNKLYQILQRLGY